MTEEALFELALKTPTEERALLLDRICKDDSALRERIEKLLAADVARDESLNLKPTTSHHDGSESEGAVVAGRYKLRQHIGEGGMGTVWVADQTEPVKRKVALKLIKKGMDSRSVLARFEQERQALAVMDHPNIAKVLDGGLTETGQPFFVMELVAGRPLVKFCDEAKLGLRERLELFVPICQAVQHAHQKGIIHRDLKPANILVTLVDGKPTPKIIDFGVAKAVTGKLTEESLSTHFGAVVGTIEYMAPEQAGLTTDDVDTRADVYSLGVILYELLTGLRPFDSKRLRQAALDELLRIVREEEPPSLASRLSTDESLATAAALRGVDPKKLLSLVRGELDWIVRRCLEKDRNRRYETANGVARDVQRYLADEPVEARPASTAYRLRKFVRRNRVGVFLTSFAAACIVAILFNDQVARRQLRAERDRAIEAETKQGEAAAAEKQANAQAQKRLTQLEKGNEILTDVFKDLDVSKVREGTEPLEAILSKQLIKAAEKLDGEAVGDPLVVAGLQFRLAMTLVNLGHPNAAVPLLVKAREARTLHLGSDHRETLNAMAELAEAYNASGQRQLGAPLQQESLKRRKAVLGPDHLDTLETLNNVAVSHLYARRPDRALPLLEECLRQRKANQGADLMGTLTVMGNLAGAYGGVGKLDQAIQMTEENLQLSKTALEPDHPHVFHAMNNLAMFYDRAGRPDEAVRLHEETLKRKRDRLGSEHPETLKSMHNLAESHEKHGRADLALPIILEAAALVEKRQFQYEGSARILGSLMTCYERLNQIEKAEATRRKWTAVVKDRSGADSPAYGTELAELGNYLLQQKKWTEAETVFRECLALRKKIQPDVWTTFNVQAMLGGALLGQKKYAEAEPLLLKGHEGMKKREKRIAPHSYLRFIEAHERLVELYKATIKPDEEKKWQAELASALKRKPAAKK